MLKHNILKTKSGPVYYRLFNPQAKGVPLICLHGYADDSQQFTQLAQLLPHHPLYCPDFPMIHDDQPATIDSLTTFITGFIDALDLNHFTLVGFSLGGLVAVHIAQHHPQLINHTYLLNTPSRLLLSPIQKIFIPTLLPILSYKSTCFCLSQLITHPFLRRLIHLPPCSPLTNLHLKHHPYALFKTLALLLAHQELFNPHLLPTRTLMIYTQDDLVLPYYRYQSQIQSLPRQVFILPQGGHAAQSTYWPQIADLLKNHPSGWLVKGQSPGHELFSPAVARILSSPLMRFTTLFGMGRGGTTSLQ